MPIERPLCGLHITVRDLCINEVNVNAVSKLVSSATYEPSSNQRIVYVSEGEIAVNIPESSFDVIGSDDATTCHIILARTVEKNPHWLVAHIDSVDLAVDIGPYLVKLSTHSFSIDRSLSESKITPDRFWSLDIFVSGGIEGDKLSDDISARLLQTLTEVPCSCNVLLWNTSGLNNRCRYVAADVPNSVFSKTKINSNSNFAKSNAASSDLVVYPHVLGLGFCRERKSVLPIKFFLSSNGLRHHFPGGHSFETDVYLNDTQCCRAPCFLLRNAVHMLEVFAADTNVSNCAVVAAKFREVCNGQTDMAGALMFRFDLTALFTQVYSPLISHFCGQLGSGKKRQDLFEEGGITTVATVKGNANSTHRAATDSGAAAFPDPDPVLSMITKACQHVGVCRALPAHSLLKCVSTSPHCEPPHFVPVYITAAALMSAIVSHFNNRLRERGISTSSSHVGDSKCNVGDPLFLPELLFSMCEEHAEYISRESSSSIVSAESTSLELRFCLNNSTCNWDVMKSGISFC